MSNVWERSRSKGTQRLVLLAIADCANDDGVAWPSFLGLTRKTLLGRSTVIRLLNELRSLGELEIDAGGGRASNVYRVRLPHLSEADAKGATRPIVGPVPNRDVPLRDGSSLPGETAPVPPGEHEPSLNRQRTTNTQTPLPGFDEFWREYPRKDGKPMAVKAWNKIAPDETQRSAILAGLRRQKAAKRWWIDKDGRQGGQHASTWLNNRMWTDDVAVAAAPRAVGVGADVMSSQQTRDYLRRTFG